MKALRTIYRFWAALLFVAVLVQVGFAGYGAFFTAAVLEDQGDTLGHQAFDHAWRFHTGFGYAVVYGTVILLLLGLLARLGRPRIWWPLALAIAGVVQLFLAYLGESHAKAGFLHPLDALVIFTLSGLIAHRAWRSPAP
jgi:hypothetical protein